MSSKKCVFLLFVDFALYANAKQPFGITLNMVDLLIQMSNRPYDLQCNQAGNALKSGFSVSEMCIKKAYLS